MQPHQLPDTKAMKPPVTTPNPPGKRRSPQELRRGARVKMDGLPVEVTNEPRLSASAIGTTVFYVDPISGRRGSIITFPGDKIEVVE